MLLVDALAGPVPVPDWTDTGRLWNPEDTSSPRTMQPRILTRSPRGAPDTFPCKIEDASDATGTVNPPPLPGHGRIGDRHAVCDHVVGPGGRGPRAGQRADRHG